MIPQFRLTTGGRRLDAGCELFRVPERLRSGEEDEGLVSIQIQLVNCICNTILTANTRVNTRTHYIQHSTPTSVFTLSTWIQCVKNEMYVEIWQATNEHLHNV